VKVYLVSGKKCIAKAKTTAARKTLDPLYQQMLAFSEPFQGCILQVNQKFLKRSKFSIRHIKNYF
jgi:regulating synaptic membrane exocytosis protein 2